MKSERVTQAWEFYRDNCPGFKEPMRKKLRNLDGYVSSIEAENAKLRELVLEIWRSCPVSEDDCAKCQHRIEESDEVWCDIPILMSELGIEVDT